MEALIILTFTLTFLFMLAHSQEMKNIFILAGQSNMQGLGGSIKNNRTWDGVVPVQCQPNPVVFRLNPDYAWEQAREPLHEGVGVPPYGIGPGMPFSYYLLKKAPGFGPIGLVPCAVGNTGIMEWSKGTPLYNTMLARAAAARVNGGGGVLRGILWYQGEKDALNLDDANMYKTRFEAFVNDVRSDLQSPSLPVIEVALGLDALSQNLVDIVRQAQLETPEEILNVKCAEGKGLHLEEDNIHVTTYGQILLGQQLACMFLDMSS